MTDRLKYIVSWTAWPVLLVTCLLATGYGFAIDHPVIVFNITYFTLAAILYALEQTMPHEREWHASDGQTFANIAHTLMSKGTVQTVVIFSGVIGLASLVTPVSEPGYSIWPRDWPLWIQVVMGITIAEFGLYWAHRLEHEVPFFWRFHAIHHSVVKLWIINTGRFHFVDSLMSIVLSMAILLALGAPEEVLVWLAAVTAFIGILTHCNVEMRFGPISWVFNTPGLHRWHHSRDIREGNKNYGENLMVWDQVFGTYFNPDRRPPTNIGIDDYMPEKFIDQLAWPFLPDSKRKEIAQKRTA